LKDAAFAISPRRGRPRKFEAPSRAVTLTLPEHVIEALEAIDGDPSRAIVRLIQPNLAKRPHPPAELATFGSRAVIVVNPTRTLEQHTGVHLIPLPDGRALISFDAPLTIADLELMIEDAMDIRELSISEVDGVNGALIAEAAAALGQGIVKVINFVNEGNVYYGSFGGICEY